MLVSQKCSNNRLQLAISQCSMYSTNVSIQLCQPMYDCISALLKIILEHVYCMLQNSGNTD